MCTLIFTVTQYKTNTCCDVDAGPAGIVSWALAGIGCIFSGLSYAELSSVIPAQGGAYAYAFVALGELPAAITAWCLTLEVGWQLG